MTNHATVDAFIQALEFYYQVTLEYSLAQTRAAWLANYLFHVPLHSRAVGAVSCDQGVISESKIVRVLTILSGQAGGQGA